MFLSCSVILVFCITAFTGEKDTLILDEWAAVTGVIGTAQTRPSDEGAWRPVHVGMRVKMTWEVRTDSESSVELAFQSGTQIRLRENSMVKLATLVNDTQEESGDGKKHVTAVTDKQEE